MNIAEFCEGRNVDSQAVRKYLIRHPELFDGKTGKRGREIFLLPAAVEILEKKYPLIKPVQIVNGVDSDEYSRILNELNETKNQMIRMMEIKSKLEIELKNLQTEKFLLEETKNSEIEKIKSEYEEILTEKNETHRKVIDRQKIELEYEKKRKLSLREAAKRVIFGE